MKYAIINDSHIGVKNSTDTHYNHIRSFFLDTFIPYCIEHRIKDVIHLGDWFDSRSTTSVHATILSHEISTEFTNRNINVYIILGNHDILYKNTLKYSATREFFKNSRYTSKIKIVSYPYILDDFFALMPWICKENYDDSMKFIAKSSTFPVLCGHFEMSGFAMMRGGSVLSHGLKSSLFNNYELVLSGHYHTKSTRDNISYLGTQYDLTWADCEDLKYFHVYDTSNRELTPVSYNNRIYFKIRYDETKDIESLNLFPKNSYIRIISINSSNRKRFEEFVRYVEEELTPIDLSVVQPFNELSHNEIHLDADEVAHLSEDLSMNTEKLLHNYIDKSDSIRNDKSISAKILKTFSSEIYKEAIAL